MATERRAASLVAAVVAACGGDDGGAAVDAPATIDAAATDAGTPDASADAAMCAGDGTGQGNGGFVRPVQVSRSWNQDAMLVGPADWSCAPIRMVTPHAADLVEGQAVNLQNDVAVSGALIEAFTDGDIMSTDAMSTTDGGGVYSLNLPAATDLAFRATATDFVPTVNLAPRTDDEVLLVATGTAAAYPALVGITYDGKPWAVGVVRDCAGNAVSDVVVTISLVGDCVIHAASARTFYFGDSGLPTRNNIEPVSTENGFYFVFLDAAASGQIQVWGFADGDDPVTGPLRLLATRDAVMQEGVVTVAGSFDR